MQRLAVLIGQAADWHEELKQELAFVITSKQCRAKHLATLREVKESNAAIKRDLTARKASLQAQQDDDNEDEKPIPLTQIVSALALILTLAVTIEDDNNDLDEVYSDYVNALINSSRNF